ncbi:MAG TPA: hypothetical protein VIM61_08700 [Chthoniobacterales bacterium]|jgi:hypothetical protein
MQKSFLAVLALVFIASVTGCVSVKEREPETTTSTTTTRHTSLAPIPASTTTVERTTTY